MGNKMKISLIYHSVSLTFVTVLIVIVGAFSSLYSAEISQVFPFSITFYNGSYTPYIFWFLLIGTALLFYYRQKKEDEDKDATTSELLETIRTLPPKDFLNTFVTSFNEAHALKHEGMLVNDKTSVEKYLRSMLKVVLTLISKYDRSTDAITYGVNIMIYRDKNEIKDEPGILKRMLFWDEGNLNNLQGILELNTQLSVNSETIQKNDIEADDKIKDIILPIPIKTETKTADKLLSNVLPGAPMALIKNALSRFRILMILITGVKMKAILHLQLKIRFIHIF
jgi:hypothetical protein